MTEAAAQRGVALVLPGQGSQKSGMLEELPAFKGLDEMIAAAERASGLDLSGLSSAGPAEALSDTRVAQPLLYVADWVWGAALMEAGVAPVAIAGHSLGELAALSLAGVYDFATGLTLVVERSRLMGATARTTPGGMTAVLGLDGPAVSEAIAGIDGVWLANDNCPGQVVVSGTHAGLEAAAAALEGAGARRLVSLPVAGPFHSPLMAPAAEAFAGRLAEVEFHDALFPVVSNSLPELATAGDVLRERLAGQIVSPVRWSETMHALLAAGAPLLVEAGPGSVLTGLARRMDGIAGVSAEERGVGGVLEEVAA